MWNTWSLSVRLYEPAMLTVINVNEITKITVIIDIINKGTSNAMYNTISVMKFDSLHQTLQNYGILCRESHMYIIFP